MLSKDGHLLMLKYSFKHGNHKPSNVRHFRGILESLKTVHTLGYTHGDIRIENMVMEILIEKKRIVIVTTLMSHFNVRHPRAIVIS